MIVTILVNTACSLHCPHCYLPPRRKNSIISKRIIDWIFTATNLKGIVLVGMEPLLNERVAEMSKYIGRRCQKAHIPFSLITNGMTLRHDFARKLTHIISETDGTLDVSLDGGPVTYDRPGGNYRIIVEGIHSARDEIPELRICILHTIYTGWTEARVTDSLRILDEVPDIYRVIFSLYIDTDRIEQSPNRSIPLSSSQALDILISSNRFCSENRAIILVDEYHARSEDTSLEYIDAIAKEQGVSFRSINSANEYTGKLLLIGDPVHLGANVRIHPQNDGAIMLAPWDALHTGQYQKFGIPCDTNQSFEAVVNQTVRSYFRRYPKN